MSDLNTYICTGRLGADPEQRSFPNGDPVVNMRVAVSETWKERSTGERKERTLWLSVVVMNKGLCSIAGQYLKKGSKVALQGSIQSRSYEKNGQDVWVTELVLGPYNSTLTMLDGKSEQDSGYSAPAKQEPEFGNDDSSIPF